MLKTFEKILIIFSIVAVIGGTLTFVMTWNNIGFGDGFLHAWLSSFALCVVCIAPIGGVIAMLINKILRALLPDISAVQMNVIFGLCMAVIMESIMAVVTTMNINDFSDWHHFFYMWMASLLTALPIGIFFSIILSLVIKPKLEIFWAK
ncbi:MULTISPECIES: DUF2798 domain-containing protein [Psychrobacter]|uniref:DUF2798 domain-containing protein n=1 Tax=Psychrobacter TaxID=497 RepID=UPI000ED4A80D|nr:MULTISPECIES: DUF2798 domain-containing protein [Psychrobacter]HCT72799.1 hypothetical protein [Psychrobacter sp.]